MEVRPVLFGIAAAILIPLLLCAGCEPPKERIFVVECPGQEKKETAGTGIAKDYSTIRVYSRNQTVAIFPDTCSISAKVATTF